VCRDAGRLLRDLAGAKSIVVGEQQLDAARHIIDPDWAPKIQWRLSPADGERQQRAGSVEVGQPGYVIGVQMRDENRVDVADGCAFLLQSQHDAAGVEQQLLPSGFDERAHAEAIEVDDGGAGAQQRHLDLLRRRAGVWQQPPNERQDRHV